MSDDRPTGDKSAAEGSDGARKRRRRRRRPRGEAAPGSSEASSGDAVASDSAAEAGTSGDSSGARKRRRRRSGEGNRGGRSGDESPRRARRESSAPRGPAPRAEAPRAPQAPPPPGVDEVDLGWDESPLAVVDPPPQPRLATRAPQRGDADSDWDADEVDTSIKYGDDADAPTPEVRLAADLPPEPAGDHDGDPASMYLIDDEAEHGSSQAVHNIVGVKFSSAGRIYDYDGGDATYARGDEVLVDSDRGPCIGTVATSSFRRPHGSGRLKRVLRRPDKNDARTIERNARKEDDLLRAARDAARALKLPIKVFRAEMSHAGAKKARVYFTSDDRIDFRDMVRDLSRTHHVRVEMRQTGVRDQAKMVGGIGSCGMELCCTTWLPEFVPVSIKNAKDQGLVLNPSKVSGQCGRLKCCLVYEQETYAALRKGLPKLGKRVITELGEGRVVEVDVLRQRVRVSHPTGDVVVFGKDEVKPMFPSQQQASKSKAKSGRRPADDTPEDDASQSNDAPAPETPPESDPEV